MRATGTRGPEARSAAIFQSGEERVSGPRVPVARNGGYDGAESPSPPRYNEKQKRIRDHH